MFHEAISLLWTSMNNWLTPTFLFLLLNLMIGTIFVTSAFASSKPQYQPQPQQQHQHQHQHQITRTPSILERFKSINFYSYYSHVHKDQPIQTHNITLHQQFHNSQPETDKIPESASELISEKFTRQTELQTNTQIHSQTQSPLIEEDTLTFDDEGPTLEEIYNKIKSTTTIHHYNRQKSDTKPAGGEIPVRLPAKMKKSASHKSAFNHFQPVFKPENVGHETVAVAVGGGGGSEVDERADDFINRFKKQLQLQRVESILRYKEMLTKGRG